MKTREMLDKLPENHRKYLETMKADIRKVKEMGNMELFKEYRAVARGYIRCLVESGIVGDFKTVWCWFTV